MKRVMLTVAYDGTAYKGWQIQPECETVQGVLQRVLNEQLGEDINVIGASRTDAGVHAEGAVAVFDTESPIPPEKFSYVLNRLLPDDIVIRRSQEVPGDFHPRRTNTRKTYRYSIWHDEFAMPTKRLYNWHVYLPLDIDRMKRAAEHFVGEHDFEAFCSAGAQVESTVRTIYDIKIVQDGDPRRIDIYVTGNGFLYNMVRLIAGTLVESGSGRIDPDEISDIIESRDKSRVGIKAPACGLTLVGYEFPEYPELSESCQGDGFLDNPSKLNT